MGYCLQPTEEELLRVGMNFFRLALENQGNAIVLS